MVPTFSLVSTPLCSKAHRHDTAVVRIAAAVRPARHTQFGRMMSFTKLWANSPKRFLELMVVAEERTRRERRAKNLSRISGSLSGCRQHLKMAAISSSRSPTTGPTREICSNPVYSWSGLTRLSRHSVQTYQENKFTDNSSGNAHPQSSKITEPLWTDPGLKSRTGVLELFLIKWEKAQVGNDSSPPHPPAPKNPQISGKSHHWCIVELP